LNVKDKENEKIENKEKTEISTEISTEKLPTKNPRQSNIELLRIIAMLLIISHNFAEYGNFSFLKTGNEEMTVNHFWIRFLTIGGRIAVGSYILNSGYFLIYSKSIKFNKVLKLIFQIYTYSILNFLVGYFAKAKNFRWATLLSCLFPISYCVWWFASEYVILYLLSTIINRLLNRFDRVQYRTFLLFTTFIWFILPTVSTMDSFFHTSLLFFYLYCLAGYFRKYSFNEKNYNSITFIIISIVLYLVILGIVIACEYLGLKYSFFNFLSSQFYKENGLFVILSTIFLFLGFLKLNITSKIINFISTTMFGIYLLHDSPYLREIIWERIFKCNTYKDNNYFILYSIGVILAVFTACSIVEMIRIYTIEKLYLKSLDNLSVKLINLYQKFCNTKLIKNI